MNSKVVAIDGPAYVGKSQIAKELANLTGYCYINTGHMYRIVAKYSIDHQKSSEKDLLDYLHGIKIEFENGRTMVNGQDWTDKLDHSDIVLQATQIAKIGKIREFLTVVQRRYAEGRMIIMEGRDIGSVIFPDAMWKFFVTASVGIRAKRMIQMMSQEEKDSYTSFEDVLEKIKQMDDADFNRKIAPLKIAEDAIVYDNSLSPTAAQDAHVLFYYMMNTDELIKNVGMLKESGKGAVTSGIDS